MEKEDLKKLIIPRIKKDRISCSEAFALAREYKVPPKEIGKLLNDMNIKIQNCQLGCF
jgi:hypothetical protein